MSFCFMKPFETYDRKINKFALKLLGISNHEVTEKDILECLRGYIEPTSIELLLFDAFNNFYVLFLTDIHSTCALVGKRIALASHYIHIYPLLECFRIDNVYPCLKNEDLRDIFKNFGNVYTISNQYAVPNSSKFSHILSGKREITFLLPGKEKELCIPLNVISCSYLFHVRKFCCACLTEGHSILYCPDIDNNEELPKIKDEESDDELEALIKHDYVSDTESTSGASMEIEGSSQDVSKNNIATSGASMEIEGSSQDVSKNNIAASGTSKKNEGPSQDKSENNTDSQVAIFLLPNYCENAQVYSCRMKLYELKKSREHITLQWIPSHCDLFFK